MSKAFRNTLLAISITYIVLGLIQILWPIGSRMVICYILGAALTLFGIYHIVRYFAADTGYMFTGMGLALGVASTVGGILMLKCAKAVVALFGVVLGIAVISDSILRMQLSFNMMRCGIKRYIPVMVFAFVMLAAGVVMLFNPIKSAAAATTVMGVCMMIDGIMNIISVIFAKKMAEE